MIVQKCDFCDQKRQCTPITGEHGIYAICETCAKAMLAREICRVIGHGWIDITHYSSRSLLTGHVYAYTVERCTRCNHTRGFFNNLSNRRDGSQSQIGEQK